MSWPELLRFVMPPIVFTALFLWTAGGFWCEKNVALGCGVTSDAMRFIAFMLWFLVLIALLLLFLGSLVGAVIGSYV